MSNYSDLAPKKPDDTSADSASQAGLIESKTEKEKTPGNNKQLGNGVVLVTCADPTIFAVAVAVIVHGIHTDAAIAGLRFRPVSAITFMHASGSHDARSVKSYARASIEAGKLNLEAIPNCSRLDLLVPVGVHLILRDAKPGTCVMAAVEYRNLKRDDTIAALRDLNAEAEKLGVLVVIYVLHTKKQDVTWLRDHCAVAIEVRKCEPGPDAAVAIVLDNLTLASEHVLGIGCVMVEAFRESDGCWTYRFEPFIAERAVIRVAWNLANEGMKLRDIAMIVGIAASNVSRGFQPLLIQPQNAVGLAPSVSWRDRWARSYDLTVEKLDVKEKRTDSPLTDLPPRTRQQG